MQMGDEPPLTHTDNLRLDLSGLGIQSESTSGNYNSDYVRNETSLYTSHVQVIEPGMIDKMLDNLVSTTTVFARTRRPVRHRRYLALMSDIEL